MPWELGYFDGLKGKVAILPIVDTPTFTEDYKGQEYLGLYYYVTKGNAKNENIGETLWINKDEKTYIHLPAWLDGKQPSLLINQ